MYPGPVLSATFHLGLPDDPLPPDFYGRADNPTWRALEAGHRRPRRRRVRDVRLRHGRRAAVLRLRAGPSCCPSDGYYVVRALARDEGRTVREVPTAGPWPDDVLDGAGLVLLETPSNPGLDVCDIAALAAAAHAAGALVAVDNTTATPLGQRPLELGADLTLASDTKALAGHDDVVLGHVSTRDAGAGRPAARAAHPRRRRAGPDGGVARPPRARHARPAPRPAGRQRRRTRRGAARTPGRRGGALARPSRRPGARDRPAADAAVERRRGHDARPASAVARFLAAARLVASATSFGGVRTSADRRQRWGDAVPPGFLRLSVGCEDADDLVADVRAALDAVLDTR